MSKYKAIIFDFDNTLVDSNSFAAEFTKSYMAENNIVGDWEKFFETDSDKSNDFWEKYWKVQGAGIKTFKEDRDALFQIKQNGIKMGIVSRSSPGRIDEILSNNGIKYMFQIIVGDADKSDVQYLSQAVEALGEKSDDVLYVGDEQEDIELGKRLEVDTAYILRSGEKSQKSYAQIHEWLETHEPTYQINNLIELANPIQ
jgi:HAD superfamily hydrolase (TIGR01549 family)